MKPPKPLAFLYFLFCCGMTVMAQERTSSTLLQQQPGNVYSSNTDKASAIDGRLDKATENYLCKLQKQDAKLKAKRFKKDAESAHELSNGADQKIFFLKNLYA